MKTSSFISKFRYNKIDILWIIFTTAARIAPLSAIPILITKATNTEADLFVLIQTNAAIISILFGFSQSSFINKNYKKNNLPSIIILTYTTPVIFFLLTVIIVFLLASDYYFWLSTLILALFTAYTPQSQALLRCTRAYLRAVIADIIRISFYAGAITYSYFKNELTPVFMVALLSFYYVTPALVMGIRKYSTADFRSIFKSWESSATNMAILTFSSLISIAAWMSIRYSLSHYGDKGELSIFSAIMSISSMLALMTDMMFIRVGQRIILASRERKIDHLMSAAKTSISYLLLSTLATTLVSIIYVSVQFNENSNHLFIAAILIVFGYFVRGIYIFMQNILLGIGISRFDLFGSTLMLLVSITGGSWSVKHFGLVGAASVFAALPIIYLLILLWGSVKFWRIK